MIAVYKKFFLMLGVTALLCLSTSVVWSKEYELKRGKMEIKWEKFTSNNNSY